ncbi:zinc knuckle CX2CX4HX4C containing protein [Tanacetum coccineum]|uniref:Zinc knuckle CX2CX4HX4C containing protein n=1 Tax=Tanacetum coccineum TaxID=301880 RepID=A0ABQ5BWK7_9ASTR
MIDTLLTNESTSDRVHCPLSTPCRLYTALLKQRNIMAEGKIDNLTMEKYLALTRGNQAPAVKRWVDRLSPGTVDSWDLLKKAFIQRYCLPSKTAKQLEEFRNFKQEGARTLYQVWERYNDLLYKCPTHDINSHPKVNIFYNGLGTMNRQLLDLQGPIPGMTPAQALTAIQTMADHSQKWHDGSSSMNIDSISNSEGIAAIVSKLDNCGRDVKKLKENVHAIQVGCQLYRGAHLDKECPLNEEVKSMEEVKYGEFGRPFPNNNRNDDRFNRGVSGYDQPSSSERRPSLTETINKYMEEAAKRHAEQDKWLKKFYQSSKTNREAYDKIIQGLETKKIEYFSANSRFLDNERQETDKSGMEEGLATLDITREIKEDQDPGSFILPCSIEWLDFNNALEDLGASISIMPLSMYKRLGMGKLEPINMMIEMANNTKCTPKRIVENLLVKFDKFIFPVDFVILDMVEEFRMPIILGRPLLAITYAKVDIFRKSISLEVGNEKVIFKMRSSFTTTILEYVRAIRSETCPEDDDFKKIDHDLFLYDYESCEFNRLLGIDPDIFSYDIDIQESYEEIVYKITQVVKEIHLTPKEKKRERFGYKEDDIEENLEDPEECEEDKANIIIGAIHDKLNDDWFNGKSEDEDDLEGILDYLEPKSYDGIINLDYEAYNQRKCRLLGSTYKEPPPILIEKVKITRYTIGLEEIYTKVKVLGNDEMLRTRDNIAAIRAGLMEKMAKNRSGQEMT